jgi:hypothetical protein
VETTEKKFLLVCQIVAVLYLMYCTKRANQIEHLITTQDPQKFLVLETYCHGRSSNIDILYSKGKKNIEYPSRECFDIVSGDSIALYYSAEHDFFHIPGSPKYKNTVWGLAGFLILSLIPWRKLFKKLGWTQKKNDI